MLQHDRQLKAIAARLEKKIKSELLELMNTEREKYDEFFKNFGLRSNSAFMIALAQTKTI
jgi:molecular chaperone HtpG